MPGLRLSVANVTLDLVCPSFYHLPPSPLCRNRHKVPLPLPKGCGPFPFVLEEYTKERKRGTGTYEVGQAVRFLFTLSLATDNPQTASITEPESAGCCLMPHTLQIDEQSSPPIANPINDSENNSSTWRCVDVDENPTTSTATQKYRRSMTTQQYRP